MVQWPTRRVEYWISGNSSLLTFCQIIFYHKSFILNNIKLKSRFNCFFLAWVIHKKWMKDENMLKKKDFDDAGVVAALRRGHRQRLYFEQIAVFRHKFMNYSD